MPDEDSRKNGPKTGKSQPPVEFQFKPGNPGRPKGARNKLGEAFIEDLLVAWESQGAAAIQTVIEKRPQDFLKVVASLMPKDLNVNINPIGEMTDEQLIERIRKLDATIQPFLASTGKSGTGGGDRQKTTH
jgi:hypothetical protein